MRSIVVATSAKASMSSLKNRAQPSRHIEPDKARERKDALYRLGMSNYAEYLRSDLWKRIRLAVLERDGHKCRKCGEDANQVHHQFYDYATLSGQHYRYLFSSCGNCHRHAHKHRKAQRMSPHIGKIPTPNAPHKCPSCGVAKAKPTLCRACQTPAKKSSNRKRRNKANNQILKAAASSAQWYAKQVANGWQ